MTATPASNKLAQKLGDSDIAEALDGAGLSYPVAIENAEDSAIEDAVGSQNLAAVRAVFPAQQE